MTSPSEGGAHPEGSDEPSAGQLDLLAVAPLPPCSLCGAKSFRPGCLRCDSRRWLFRRPLPPPRPPAEDPESLARKLADVQRLERLRSLARPVRVALIGCGRSKLQRPAPAAQLYTGSLFRQALAFSEGRFDERYILSAQHELVALDQLLHPYELDLRSMRRREREGWGSRVAGRLQALFTGLQVKLTFLCGHEYAVHVRWNLPRSWSVEEPLRGLPLGRRLAALSGALCPATSFRSHG